MCLFLRSLEKLEKVLFFSFLIMVFKLNSIAYSISDQSGFLIEFSIVTAIVNKNPPIGRDCDEDHPNIFFAFMSIVSHFSCFFNKRTSAYTQKPSRIAFSTIRKNYSLPKDSISRFVVSIAH